MAERSVLFFEFSRQEEFSTAQRRKNGHIIL
jgi:hypothetical protein